ncbi:MAG TPA: hypothetical protein VHW01_14120 [Polyangiaceae bacterium]|nr:hypothetical protein [Polyangiaceae bacterium]
MQISYSPAGHETMAAIAEELLGPSVEMVSETRDDAPEVSFAEGPVGRETLALIAEEARPLRVPQDTLNYGDRISNAPGAKTPSRAPAPPAERESPSRAASPESSAGEAPFAIFEMLTFVVQGPEIAQLSSDAVRRRFVEEHLLHRLPAKDMAQVDRVDVTPWTVRGTVVVRVWCKL